MAIWVALALIAGVAANASVGVAPQAPAAPHAPGAVIPVRPTATPAADRALAPPAALATRTAMAFGYREGYNGGQADANRQAAYDPNASQEYQAASIGYRKPFGDANQYKLNFRSGFTSGYADGFYHRRYNASIGDRSLTTAPAATATAAAPPSHANPPTASQRAAARPSAVDAAGLLVPQGTRVQATINDFISTRISKDGDLFSANVSVPIRVGPVVAIPAGSVVEGVLESVDGAGTPEFRLRYRTLRLPGRKPIFLQATTIGLGARSGAVIANQGSDNPAPQAGGSNLPGAAIPTVHGGVLGGGPGVGGGGAAGVLITPEWELNPGDLIRFRLDAPLEIPPTASPS